MEEDFIGDICVILWDGGNPPDQIVRVRLTGRFTNCS